MKIEAWRNNLLPLLLISTLLLSGLSVNGIPYDYGFTSECLENPHKPQYDGGIVANPELKDGLKGWSPFGDAKIARRVSESGNEFIVAHNREQPHHSVSQDFFLDKDKLYTVSAWLQVSHGEAEVAAMFKTPSGFQHAAWVTARSGCWSMLKGGLTVNVSGPAHLYFESKNTSTDIWVDSVSVQPFTQEEWRSHQDESIDKVRKSKVRIQVVDAHGKPKANHNITIGQKFSRFPLGCAINKNILGNTAYQNWFTSRFQYTTFENEMKWYSNEPSQGHEDYSAADAMLGFAQSHGIQVRGHNVFWDDPAFQPSWVKNLGSPQLSSAAQTRINSVMRRYSGKVIAWDVVNENMHTFFFESKLGPTASAQFYKTAALLDRRASLFLNEFNTIEEPGDGAVTPDKYLAKIGQLRQQGYNGGLSIGLEGHFKHAVNIPYMRSAIDKLATAKLPIWITELDVRAGSDQASLLEQILREARAHPAVGGIVIWSAWSPQGCYQMCLTDNNFRNLPTGDVVDKIAREWSPAAFAATTDADGFVETSLFHGDYHVSAVNVADKSSSATHSFTVESHPDVLHVKVSA